MGKDDAVLDIDRAVNLIFTFFILSQETTLGIVAATVKLVADNPDVMEEWFCVFTYQSFFVNFTYRYMFTI